MTDVLGNNVWIGEGVIVFPRVTIGNGAVIGVHSNINMNISQSYAAVGASARIIKRYNSKTGCCEWTASDGCFL